MHFNMRVCTVLCHLFSTSVWMPRALDQRQHLHPGSDAESKSVVLESRHYKYF